MDSDKELEEIDFIIMTLVRNGVQKVFTITKHGKIVEVYDLKRHIWSDGLAGLIIKEECRLADLKEWEFANVRSYVIKELLSKSKD